jgi:hypothetical protein
MADKEQPYRWLKFRDIKRGRGGVVVTAQDQALSITALRRKI